MSGDVLNIIIAGEAGQGVQLASDALGRAFVRGGYHVFASQSAMSRIRGGHNFSRLRVSSRPVAADGGLADLLIALSPELAELHFQDLTERGVVLCDDSVTIEVPGDLQLIQVPLKRLAVEQGGNPVMANSVALGAALGLVEYYFDILAGVLEDRFAPRGGETVGRNIACAQVGYDLMRVRARRGTLGGISPLEMSARQLFLSGSQAMALGAVAGGVRVACGYPMSPGTSLLETLAGWSKRTEVHVEQVEDELAAINLAVGASFAGSLGLVATAGGGFALMNEGMSLAGMTETPVVVCVGMRPGPATGLATRTAQGDLLSSIYAGHGEYPRAILVPGDGAQAFDAVFRACHLAVRHQTPVVVLFDEYLADALWTVDPAIAGSRRQVGSDDNASWFGTQPYSYERYEMTPNGVSPRIMPGRVNQVVYVDSDEHTSAGHITESAEIREQMVAKRLSKVTGLREATMPPIVDADDGAEFAVVSVGSTNGAVAEATSRLRAGGARILQVGLCDIWPFPSEHLRTSLRGITKLVTVEGNYTGQVAQLIEQECGIKVARSFGRYDGRQHRTSEVESWLGEELGATKS